MFSEDCCREQHNRTHVVVPSLVVWLMIESGSSFFSAYLFFQFCESG